MPSPRTFYLHPDCKKPHKLLFFRYHDTPIVVVCSHTPTVRARIPKEERLLLMAEAQEAQVDRSPVFSMRGITKSFGALKANDAIDLDIFESEVLALLGENGAGKSTLVKILYGFYQADGGGIEHRGEPVMIHTPQDARRAANRDGLPGIQLDPRLHSR